MRLTLEVPWRNLRARSKVEGEDDVRRLYLTPSLARREDKYTSLDDAISAEIRRNWVFFDALDRVISEHIGEIERNYPTLAKAIEGISSPSRHLYTKTAQEARVLYTSDVILCTRQERSDNIFVLSDGFELQFGFHWKTPESGKFKIIRPFVGFDERISEVLNESFAIGTEDEVHYIRRALKTVRSLWSLSDHDVLHGMTYLFITKNLPDEFKSLQMEWMRTGLCVLGSSCVSNRLFPFEDHAVALSFLAFNSMPEGIYDTVTNRAVSFIENVKAYLTERNERKRSAIVELDQQAIGKYLLKVGLYPFEIIGGLKDSALVAEALEQFDLGITRDDLLAEYRKGGVLFAGHPEHQPPCDTAGLIYSLFSLWVRGQSYCAN